MPEALKQTVMSGLQPRWTQGKDIQHLPSFSGAILKILLFILCIPEALRHKIMPGLQPGWTRKDIQHLPNLPSATENKICSCYVSQKHSGKKSCQALLRQKIMPGIWPGWTRKDIHLPWLSCAIKKKYCSCYDYPRQQNHTRRIYFTLLYSTLIIQISTYNTNQRQINNQNNYKNTRSE